MSTVVGNDGFCPTASRDPGEDASGDDASGDDASDADAGIIGVILELERPWRHSRGRTFSTLGAIYG